MTGESNMNDDECSWAPLVWSEWPGIDGPVIICNTHGWPAGPGVYDTLDTRPIAGTCWE